MKVDRRAWRGSKNEQRAWQEFREICEWIIYIKIYNPYILTDLVTESLNALIL